MNADACFAGSADERGALPARRLLLDAEPTTALLLFVPARGRPPRVERSASAARPRRRRRPLRVHPRPTAVAVVAPPAPIRGPCAAAHSDGDTNVTKRTWSARSARPCVA